MPKFSIHLGVDYSGQNTPQTRTSAIQVYSAQDQHKPKRVAPVNLSRPTVKNWCRKELADWLFDLVGSNQTFILGLDHGFSFPVSFLSQHQITNWTNLLERFSAVWPTNEASVTVDSIRETLPQNSPWLGSATELRLTERWTSSAKSVFQFDVQGSVAKSTHAGIPWLYQLKLKYDHKIHFWPFDGWEVPHGYSVIAEVYPSIFRNRYSRGNRTVDQQDAYCVARWLQEMDNAKQLSRYLDPPLNSEQRKIARLEGWILGIM